MERGVRLLDITDCKLKGADLRKEIADRVKDTQRVLITTLPDTLLLTQEQYDILEHDPEMVGGYGSNSRVYITPYNAMDLQII